MSGALRPRWLLRNLREAERIYGEKYGVLSRVGLRTRELVLAQIFHVGVATVVLITIHTGFTRPRWSAAMTALTLPFYLWAVLHPVFVRRRSPNWIESVVPPLCADVLILLSLPFAGDPSIAFVNIMWMAPITAWLCAQHGRLALSLHTLALLGALTVTVTPAVRTHASSTGSIAVGLLTVVGLNIATALVIGVGMHHFRLSADRADRLARLDELTGLLNRRGLSRACERWSGPMVVAVLDLDGFKRINDLHGHHEGDQLLRRVAHGLQATSYSNVLIARLGGDEFAVVGPRLDGIEGEIHNALTGIPLRASIGVACRGEDDGHVDLDALLVRADIAMYADKRAAGQR